MHTSLIFEPFLDSPSKIGNYNLSIYIGTKFEPRISSMGLNDYTEFI